MSFSTKVAYTNSRQHNARAVENRVVTEATKCVVCHRKLLMTRRKGGYTHYPFDRCEWCGAAAHSPAKRSRHMRHDCTVIIGVGFDAPVLCLDCASDDA